MVGRIAALASGRPFRSHGRWAPCSAERLDGPAGWRSHRCARFWAGHVERSSLDEVTLDARSEVATRLAAEVAERIGVGVATQFQLRPLRHTPLTDLSTCDTADKLEAVIQWSEPTASGTGNT